MLLFMVFMLMTLDAPNIKAEDEPTPIIHVQRDIQIVNAGLLLMNDTFTIEAPQGERIQFTSLKTGFHPSFKAVQCSYYYLENGRWRPLKCEETDLGESRFHGYEAKLSSPIFLEEGVALNVRASYLFVNLVSGDDDYVARIPVYPVISNNISSFVLDIKLPEGAELIDVVEDFAFTSSSEGEVWTLSLETEALKPLLDVNATIVYVPSNEDEYLVDCELLQREISILSRKLKMEDTYTITNMGPTVTPFLLMLPEDATNLVARDGVGPLTVRANPHTTEEKMSHTDLWVSPRSPLRSGDKWSFTVQYNIPKKDRVSSERGEFILTYPIGGAPHYIRRMIVATSLPEGGSLIDSDPNSVAVKSSTFTNRVLMEIGGVSPFEHPKVIIKYSRSPIWSYFRPSVWALLAIGLVAGAYLLRRREGVMEEEKVDKVKRSDLEDYLDLYRERISLLAEHEMNEASVEKREISRERFDQRSAEIMRRQKELLHMLKRLGKSVEATDPTTSDRIREISKIENNLEKVNDDLRNLEIRLRTRRVSRQDYQSRRREYLRRRRQARSRIEQIIAELQSKA